MRKGIGVGRLLFFSFVSVILIPVVSIGYYYVELENRSYIAERAIIDHESRDFQRDLLQEHVDRTITFIRDRMGAAVTAPDSAPRPKGDLQAQMLRRIRRDRFGESGHLFALSREGVLLVDPWMRDETGKNVLALADSTGRKVYAELLRAAESDSGGYVEYFSTMPGKSGQRLKTAYARSFPEWGWVICAGVFSRDQETLFAVWEDGHRRALSGQWRMRAIAFLSAIFVSLLVSFLFSRLGRREFDAFSRAFETAARSRGNIDTSRQNLDEFVRLSDSVNRVLRERDEAEGAERAGEQLYRAIVEDLPGMLCRFRPDGVLTFVNDEYCRYFNHTREELLGTSFFTLLPEESREGMRREFLTLTPGRPAVTYEHPVFLPDGDTRWQRWTDRAIFGEGAVREYQSYGEDITESRKAEETIRASEEKFSRMFRLSPSLMLLLDASTRVILDLNDACTRILGLRPEELIGRDVSASNIWVDPEERERVWKGGLEKRSIENREVHFYNRGGEERTGLLSLEMMHLGEREVVLVVVHDITSLEQTRAELRESERRVASLMDNLPGVAYRCRDDEFWTFDYASEGALEITGYSPADLVGNRTISWDGLIVPEDRDMVRETVDRCLAGHRHYVLEYRIRDRAGVEKWVWEKGLGVLGPEGENLGLEGFIVDITERKRAEEALRASEEKLRFMTENSADVIWHLDSDYRFTYVSASDDRLFGYTREELVGMPLFQLLTPEDIERVRHINERRLSREKGGVRTEVIRYELKLKSKDGRLIWSEASVNPYRDPEGTLTGYHGMLRDITERKEGEEALRASEEKYRHLLENAQEIILIVQAGKLAFSNKKTGEILGYSHEDFVTRDFQEFIHPGDRERLNERYAAVMSGTAQPMRRAVSVYHKDGDIRVMEMSSTRISWEGEPALLVFLTDVTERRKAEEALRASEEKFSRVFQSSPDIIALLDGVTRRVMDVNDAFTSITGYLPSEVRDMEPDQFNIWGSPEERDDTLALFRTEGRVSSREVSYRCKSGEIRYGLLSMEIIELPGNRVTLVVMHDITSLKETEAALRESELDYRALIHNMDNGFASHRIVVDEQGLPVDYIYTEINDAYERLTGSTREELIGRRETEVSPEVIGEAFDWIGTYGRVALTGEPVRFEAFSELRGKWFAVSAYSHTPGHFVTNFYDITDHKRAEAALRESEERFRSLVEEENGFPVQGYDRNRRVIFWNTASEKLYGYTREEALGEQLEDLILPPGMCERMIQEVEDWVYRGIPIPPEEYDLVHKDGSTVPVYSRHVLLRNRHGEPELYCIDMSLAERRQAEADLRESEARFREIFENVNQSVWIMEAQEGERFRFSAFNPYGLRVMGMTPEMIIGKCPGDIMPEDAAAAMNGYLRRCLAAEHAISYEETADLQSKAYVFHTTLIPVKNAGGEISRIIGISIDLTERKRMEKALIESEEKHRILLDESSDPIFSFASGGRYTYVNRAFAEGVGKTVGEIVGNRIHDVFDREEADKRFSVLEQVFRSGREKVFEVRVPRPDGDRFYLTTVTPIKDREGVILSVICSSKDITDRVHADEALQAEKERLAVTLRSIGDGVITTDRQGRVLLLNRVAEELTGWTQAEAEDRTLEEVFHIVNERTRERCENPVNRVLATGGVVGLANHTVLLSRDGREIVLADSGAPILDHQSRIIGVVLVFRDVTDQKRMEDELLRMEKLESVGVLAGGIAHDFNNILTGILGAISMARLYTGPGHAAHSMLQEAEHQSLRARDLTAQLLTFSKGGAPVRITASIVETVRETVNFTLRGSRVRAEFSLPEDLWTALVDLSQLSHVINNLALNSVQAMPEGGCIELGARNTVIGEDSGLPLVPGRYIQLRFRDYGVGIPREHLSRIFDPYFTTKQMGSGLGLATSWSIVKRHDGHIRVESELGAGTVFHIYLPATGITSASPPEETEQLLLGQGRVLVMDDDEGIRKTAAMLLEALGYSVVTVEEGAAAIEVYRRAGQEGEPFGAVIMDLTVPGGVGGMEAMTGLLALDPAVRAIVSSGYSTDPIMSEYSRHGFAGVLVKPYRAEDISRVLREVLGE